jgi:DNA-binding LacI/PurR family transcriptional regulator
MTTPLKNDENHPNGHPETGRRVISEPRRTRSTLPAASGLRRKVATMRDVASTANVSVQTVSNYVNGRRDLMGASTQRRVATAMADLSYHPDQTARNLRSGRTQTLGFLVLDEHRGFLADPLTDLVLAGVGDVARDGGYGILIQAALPRVRNWDLLGPVLDRRVDGAFVILSGPPDTRAWYVEQLAQREVPFALFDEPVSCVGAISVMAQNRSGAQALTEHLIRRGHHDIAFIAARVPWPVVEQRFQGYCDALNAAGVERRTDCALFEGELGTSGGAEMAEKLLSLPSPPSAIIASSDLLALGALRAARDRELGVPNDVAVAGFDDFEFAEFVHPALTTVRVPGYEMGRKAAEMMLDYLERGNIRKHSAVLAVELCVREST